MRFWNSLPSFLRSSRSILRFSSTGFCKGPLRITCRKRPRGSSIHRIIRSFIHVVSSSSAILSGAWCTERLAHTNFNASTKRERFPNRNMKSWSRLTVDLTPHKLPVAMPDTGMARPRKELQHLVENSCTNARCVPLATRPNGGRLGGLPSMNACSTALMRIHEKAASSNVPCLSRVLKSWPLITLSIATCLKYGTSTLSFE
mmetsp:Transcript_7/g.14  ORF Transcript_7/g.14 Transcript_7/m.14 type:complete len:202 (+) Transcript_7:395-1000(+)